MTVRVLLLSLLVVVGCAPQAAPEAPQPAAAAGRFIVVVVAARDLPAGTVLTEEHVRTVELPPEAVPANYASVRRDVIGLQLTQALRASEPVQLRSRRTRTIEIIRGGGECRLGDCPVPRPIGGTVPGQMR